MTPQPAMLEKVRIFGINSPLLQHRNNVTSQCGEDGIIKRIFEIIKPTYQYCVEFGAWDGKFMSNCFNLVANEDWLGVYIEGNEEKYKDLLATHGGNKLVKCLHKFVDFEGANSLDNILASTNTPKDFDLLSIDVDGTDYHIWESLTQHSPNVVVIEFNPTIPNDVAFVQAKDCSVNQGCSLLALIMLGKRKGYELACCTEWNAFFVKADLYPKLQIPSNFIYDLYHPIQDGRIFHGYDSQIYVVGMDRLVWNGATVSSRDFQVLPESMRRFGDAQRL